MKKLAIFLCMVASNAACALDSGATWINQGGVNAGYHYTILNPSETGISSSAFVSAKGYPAFPCKNQ